MGRRPWEIKAKNNKTKGLVNINIVDTLTVNQLKWRVTVIILQDQFVNRLGSTNTFVIV